MQSPKKKLSLNWQSGKNLYPLLPQSPPEFSAKTGISIEDNATLIEQRTPLSSSSSAVVNEGGFFSSVGSFFSGISSGITDFFGGSSDVGSTPFNPFPARGYSRASGISPADLMRHQLAQRESKVDIDKILSEVGGILLLPCLWNAC